MDEAQYSWQFSLRAMGQAVLFVALAATVFTAPAQDLLHSASSANRGLFTAWLYISAALAGAAIGVLFRKVGFGMFCGLVSIPLFGFITNVILAPILK